MRAVAKLNPTDPGIDIVEVDPPEVQGEGDVIVRVAVSGISGSELNIWRGTYRRPNGTPVERGRILGYEHAGVVEDAGETARAVGFEPGRRVALGSPFIGCRRCEPCQQGLVNRCRDWGHVGITLDGTNCEFARLPVEVLQLLPERVDPLDAAFLNSAALAVRAVARADLTPGDRVVVVGPGPVGLLMLQAARAGGASWLGLVGLEQDRRRLEIGKELGADETYEYSDETASTLRSATGGMGADVVLEAAGTPGGMAAAVDAVRVGGTVVFAGLPPQRIVPIEAIRVTRDELTIRGVEGNLPDDRRRALRLIEHGVLRCRPFVTHQLPIDDVVPAFEAVASGEACKAVFTLNGDVVPV
jgi:2-desacetyl-2-hydroxyethyl bacteriochlorophyllide A dehydrogenase